jgi:hypothetical protein
LEENVQAIKRPEATNRTIASRRDDGEVRQVGIEEREIDNATTKEGHAQERFRPKSEESQASDCDRPQRGSTERREGSAEAFRRPKAGGEEAIGQSFAVRDSW